MQIYLGDTPLDRNIGIRLGDNNITKVIPGIQLYPFNLEYLVIAGGGASGADIGAGGGAGGLITGSFFITGSVSLQTNVGAGGTNSNGSNSSLIGAGLSITSLGGGKGGSSNSNGNDGGASGGGGGGVVNTTQPGNAQTAGMANGGQGGFRTGAITIAAAGGGGGAFSAGRINGNGTAFYSYGGHGGSGSLWLDGVRYAGGGGGSGQGFGNPGLGGPGGGGMGGNSNNAPTGSAGAPNTGGGGGGDFSGNAGGSGIIIIRYPFSEVLASGGDEIYISGSYTYHKFLTTGVSAFSI
jgi:hypothetical protein